MALLKPMKKKSMAAAEMPAPMEPKAGSGGKNLAMAMSVQRQAKRKKLAFGGKAEATNEPPVPAAKPDNRRLPMDEYMSGENTVLPNSSSAMIPLDGRPSADDMQDAMSMAKRIIKHRQMLAQGGTVGNDQSGMDSIMKENYADGGMVDLELDSEESPNQYYKQNREAANEEQYDDDQIDSQPEDSNEHGQEREDDHDESMVGAIRRKMKSKKA